MNYTRLGEGPRHREDCVRLLQGAGSGFRTRVCRSRPRPNPADTLTLNCKVVYKVPSPVLTSENQKEHPNTDKTLGAYGKRPYQAGVPTDRFLYPLVQVVTSTLAQVVVLTSE